MYICIYIKSDLNLIPLKLTEEASLFLVLSFIANCIFVFCFELFYQTLIYSRAYTNFSQNLFLH